MTIAKSIFNTFEYKTKAVFRRCSVEMTPLEISQNPLEKHPHQRLPFNKAAGLRPATLLKKSKVFQKKFKQTNMFIGLSPPQFVSYFLNNNTRQMRSNNNTKRNNSRQRQPSGGVLQKRKLVLKLIKSLEYCFMIT